MNVASEIAAWLGENVAGLNTSDSPDGNVFIGWMPTQPERAVAVYSVPGPEADSKLPYDPAELMIVVRCPAGDEWGEDTWAAVYSAIHGLRNVVLPGGTRLVYALARQSSPFALGADANGRPQLSMDVRTEVLNTTTHRS